MPIAQQTTHQVTHHVVKDPASGEVISADVGSWVRLSFRRRLGLSRWRVADRPAHLVPIEENGHDFSFLVFGPGRADATAGMLRMVRERDGRPGSAEVRSLTLTIR
ncbi:hypothetical protein [Nocardioides dongkuii]|uniref:hypothetical protein n=1 Tax=Nocardioides dongkuii TaxID=2760089 RepID=UPI0015FA7C7B|nr:hypothetical protein [Nocardioides dongkuii]